jgi:putative NIF3 family GTP cyclohydrolase 1 type 2
VYYSRQAVLSITALIVNIEGFAHAGGNPPRTANQIIEQIKSRAGKDWSAPTVDTIKAGDPGTAVTGIATTFAATYDVLERASGSGKNLIIAHEPTFYNHLDAVTDLQNDPVYQRKLEFIKSHHMVVFRFHDHWHEPQMTPDGILHGMVTAFGWQKFQQPNDRRRFVIPEMTLSALSQQLASTLKIRALRVVGDPAMSITNVGLLPGAAGAERQISLLQRQEIQVLVAGEAREWETVEYVRDAVSEHRAKALILLGHVPSEEEGMRYCAEWLKTFIIDIPIEFIPAREPFWTPNSPKGQ